MSLLFRFGNRFVVHVDESAIVRIECEPGSGGVLNPETLLPRQGSLFSWPLDRGLRNGREIFLRGNELVSEYARLVENARPALGLRRRLGGRS